MSTQTPNEPIVRCSRCHRELKDPASIKAGIGPTCAEKLDQEKHKASFRRSTTPISTLHERCIRCGKRLSSTRDRLSGTCVECDDQMELAL